MIVNTEPTDVIRKYLLSELAKGHRYFRAKHIAEEVGLSRKVVGVRLGHMERDGEKLMVVSKFADKVWRIEPIET